MTFDSFRELNNKIETILQTYIGKNDRADLKTRIAIKLSSVYENILFETNERFRLDISRTFSDNGVYYIDVMYSRETTRMREVCECIHTLKIVDGKFTELTKEQSK